MPSRPAAPPRRRVILGLPPRTWIAMAVAFVIGLLLFVLIWSRQRMRDDFFRADGPPQSASGRQLDPLPVPDTGRIAAQTEAANASAGSGNAARIERDAAPAAPAPAPMPMPTPMPTEDALASDVPDGSVDGRRAAPPDSAPVPVSTPSPRYPPTAFRRGDSGEVLLRVHVGPDGVPMQIDLVRGSGSGLLDRAATQAVQKWRFRPALRAGQPVVGVVQVPIAFNARR
ncbi:MAG: energy transducer TonB [Luteimonas sp.]